MSLRFRLPLAFVALAALPLAVLGWYAYDQGRDSLVQRSEHEQESTAALKQGAVEDWLADAVDRLEVVASGSQIKFAFDSAPQGTGLEALAELDALLSGSRSLFLSAVLIRGTDGRVTTATDEVLVDTFRTRESHFVEGLTGPSIQGVYYSMRNQGPALTIGVPIKSNEGAVVGVLAADLDLDHLSLTLSRAGTMRPTAETYLVDRHGFVVTTRRLASAEPLTSVVSTEAVNECLGSRTSFTGTYADYRGVPVIGHATWVPTLRVCLVSEVDRAITLATTSQLRNGVFVAVLGTITLSLLLGIVFSRTITSPLARLRESAAGLSRGDDNVRLATSSTDELGQLALEFNRMANAVAEREDALESVNRDLLTTESTLRALNQNAELLSRPGGASIHFPVILERIRSQLGLENAWIYCPNPGDQEQLFTASGREMDIEIARDLDRLATADEKHTAVDDLGMAVALRGDERVQGSVGISPSAPTLSDPEKLDLLVAAANQISTALVRDRLAEERERELVVYTRQVMKAQEDERRRLARELHDETTQELTDLVRRIETLDTGLNSESVAQATESARGIVHGIRRMAQDLRPSALDDFGLRLAIEDVVDRMAQGNVLFEHTGPVRRLAGDVELALFRITQEALNNAAKHASGANVTVNLVFAERTVTIEVTDAGPGFDVAHGRQSNVADGHLGLAGMYERAELIGARFSVRSEPGEGTTIRIEADI